MECGERCRDNPELIEWLLTREGMSEFFAWLLRGQSMHREDDGLGPLPALLQQNLDRHSFTRAQLEAFIGANYVPSANGAVRRTDFCAGLREFLLETYGFRGYRSDGHIYKAMEELDKRYVQGPKKRVRGWGSGPQHVFHRIEPRAP